MPVNRSCDNLLQHLAVNIGEAALDPVVIEGQPLVIDPEQMQDLARRHDSD